jgi:hypothetical protein
LLETYCAQNANYNFKKFRFEGKCVRNDHPMVKVKGGQPGLSPGALKNG